jgi:putative ABC transport system ATP-binding protein
MSMIGFDRVAVVHGSKTVLKDLSFELTAGEKMLITGPSGIGKSTLFRLLLGFVQPSRGRVLFRGSSMNAAAAWKMRREAAYVSQALEIGGGNVSTLIGTVLEYHANRGSHRSESLDSWMEFLGLGVALLEMDVETLSGGEKQRIAILIALLLGRNLFLLDEITSNLDEALKEKVSSKFLGTPEWTVLTISHDPCWRKPGIHRLELEG